MIKVTRHIAKHSDQAEHFTWGNQCEGWFYLKSSALAIIKEKMPPGTNEKLHYHQFATQYFFIITGKATFLIDEEVYELNPNDMIEIPAGVAHRIFNHSDNDLTFLIVTTTYDVNDRIDL